MIIEDPEAFKSWLTTILGPLCDADPAALAKYVYALVKKDKPIHELRESMLSQLEVFLLNETVKFVNMLFDKLLNDFNQKAGPSPAPDVVAGGPSTSSVPNSQSSLSTLSENASGNLSDVSLSLSRSLETTPVKIKIEPNQDKSLSPDESVEASAELQQLPVAEDAPQAEKEPERDIRDNERDQDREKDHERELKDAKEKELKDRDRQLRETRDREREKDREREEEKRLGVTGLQPLKEAVPLSNGQSTSSMAVNPGMKRDLERRSPHRFRDRNKSDSEKDDRPVGVRCSRPSRRASSPRFRSRSRSWEQRHSRRSRSRDRERDRSRPWRNKSPPSRRYDRDRRRSWTKSPVRRERMPVSRSRSRSRSRSPICKFRSARYRNRSPPIPRSPSYSPPPRDKGLRFDNDPLSGPATPTQDSNHEPDLRLNMASQSIQSVVSVKNEGYAAKKRCRDFDEKGFCMRGDLCLFDHGTDPVVLEDVALPQVLSYQANNVTPMPAPRPDLLAPQDMIRPPVNLPVQQNNLPGVMTQIVRPQLIRPHVNSAEYNPDAPSMEPRMMWTRPPFRPPAVRPLAGRGARAAGMNAGPVYANYGPHQRELVHVETGGGIVPYSQPNNFQNNMPGMNIDVIQRRNFDFNRLGGGRRGGGNVSGHLPLRDNCSLELKKIPRELNNITHLNNHFSKFGNIVNIQVCFEGDPEAALITFSNHAEAYAAFKSTEAVLNNRFIRVLWHTNEGKQENVPPRRPSVKERLGAPVSTPAPSKVLNTLQPSAVQTKEEKPSGDKVVYSGNNLTKTMYIPTALKKSENLQITAILPQDKKTLIRAGGVYKKTHEIRAVKETLKKKQEEKRKEAIKLTADLRKRKQDLLDKQLKEQKLLIERLEKGGVLPEQRESIMKTLKILQQSIEKIRKDLASVVTKMSVAKSTSPVKVTPEMVKKTREETQRQILDAELDIFNQQQEGKDTTDLQKRVMELKMHAKTLGLLNSGTGVTHYPNRGKFRSSRGHTAFPHSSVDHRPTKLLVSNFGKMSKTEVLAHFAQFGEIVEYDFIDNGADSLILSFKSRKEAENAISKGVAIGDSSLSVTWFNENQAVRQDSNSLHRSIVLMCSGGEEEEEEEEDDDEEDDEEEEEGDLLEGADEDGDELQLEELGEEILFQEEDQEEEEDEERSWRR